MEEKLKSPKVSVVTPVYNAAPYLGAAIDSILAQTFADFEFLIFDDGSTDGSADIIAQNAKRDSRIRVFTSPENKGYVTHLNEGIHKARGTYIARMDADDISLPTRFAKQVAFLDQNPKVAVLGTSVQSMDKDGNISKGWILNATPDETRVHFLFTNYILHPTVMMRASMIPQEGYREEFMPAEDFDLWTRILEKHDVCSLSEPLLSYRIHATNTSSQKWGKLLSNAETILKGQLERLGVNLSASEAETYHRVTMFEANHIDTKTIRGMFDRIWKANNEKKAYARDILFSTMLGRWTILTKRRTDATLARKVGMITGLFLAYFTDLTCVEKIRFVRLSAYRALRYSFS
jgi:glycosyltransferase involved in cell wall biosynthesis